MKKIAFLFPGQGSQYVGMGRELYENFSVARGIFEEAEDTLHFSISALCFNGPEEELKLTEHTQPAILTVSVAALKVLQSEREIKPQLTAGHSLGEYSALVASEAITFSEAVRTVHFRGKFMQEAVPVGEGGMAAILGMEKEKVERLCEECSQGQILTPANYNCPGQIVIAGHSQAIERAIHRVREEGKKALPLPVSAPFHCPLMKPAGERLAKVLEGISVNDLKIPVVTNVDAEINHSKDRVKGLLVAQVSNPVRWEESMRKMIDEGIEQVLEIGPGKILSGLMKRIDGKVEVSNLEDLQSLRKLS